MAILNRYGYTQTGYSFAFPLLAKAGNGQTMVTPLTTTVGAQNWLELVNVLNSESEVTIRFLQSSGAVASTVSTNIGANAQAHYNINDILGNEQVGYAEIVPDSANSLIAQSMVYIRDLSSG